MIGGPADEVVLELPAWGSFTSSMVRLLLDGQPARYFRVSIVPKTGRPRLYCWDDPDDDSVAPGLQQRIAAASRR
jgi:hypothetical protein